MGQVWVARDPGDEHATLDPCFTLLFTFTEIFSCPGQVFPVSHGVSAEDHVSVCPGLGVWGVCDRAEELRGE